MDMLNTNTRFSQAPQAFIERSVFGRPSDLKTTHSFGKLIPLDWDEVLPAQTKNRKVGSLIRMSTPLYPVMDNAIYDIYSFFVPMRLCWNHAKEFFGENKDSAWVSDTEYFKPALDCGGKQFGEDTIFDYMGLPTKVTVPSNEFIDALPFRAYCLIWNEWFRNENVQAPININLGDDDTNNYDLYKLMNACKLHDYFTSALPAPQKGESVGLLFGDGLASVLPYNSLSLVQQNLHTLGFNPETGYLDNLHGKYSSVLYSREDIEDNLVPTQLALHSFSQGGMTGLVGFAHNSTNEIPSANDELVPINLFADLSSATINTINQLRQAISVQQYLERSARSGSRYTEYVRSAFGVISPDARLQRPELIGHHRININMSQVIQTSFEGGNDNTTPLGSTGGMSKTSDYSPLYDYSATEHGFIITLGVARTELTYQQGLAKKWSRKNRLDYYDPIFANIGEQPILNKEIYFQNDDVVNNQVFGYQEAWAEYRYKPSQVTGAFRSNHSQTLDSWHYSEYFTELPTLSDTFMQQGAEVVDRTLAVSSEVADQLLCNFWFDDTDTSPMPVYSVPGLERI